MGRLSRRGPVFCAASHDNNHVLTLLTENGQSYSAAGIRLIDDDECGSTASCTTVKWQTTERWQQHYWIQKRSMTLQPEQSHVEYLHCHVHERIAVSSQRDALHSASSSTTCRLLEASEDAITHDICERALLDVRRRSLARSVQIGAIRHLFPPAFSLVLSPSVVVTRNFNIASLPSYNQEHRSFRCSTAPLRYVAPRYPN